MTLGRRRNYTVTHGFFVFFLALSVTSGAVAMSDSDWPVHLMFSDMSCAVLLRDDHLRPFPVVWLSVVCRTGGHGRTSIACDA